jgi:hypothetical protein
VAAEPALDPAPRCLADPDPRGNDTLCQAESDPARSDDLPEREGDGAGEADDLAFEVGGTSSGRHPAMMFGRPLPPLIRILMRGIARSGTPATMTSRHRSASGNPPCGSCVDDGRVLVADGSFVPISPSMARF